MKSGFFKKHRMGLGVLACISILPVLLWHIAVMLADDPMAEIRRQTPVRIYYDGHGELLSMERTFDWQWRIPVENQHISPDFLHAVIAVEDARFYKHNGVSFRSIIRAAVNNVLHLGRRSGASTISMQLASLPSAGRKKTLADKVTQAVRAVKLERSYSKETILNEYVNRVPFGGKIHGIEAASVYYFGKSASELTLGESALLAGLPQCPNKYRPDRHIEKALGRRKTVLYALWKNGYISSEEYWNTVGSKVSLRDFSEASMLQKSVREEFVMPLALAGTQSGNAAKVYTSIVPELQLEILDVLKEISCGIPDVEDAAAVLLDSQTGEVLALIGTLDFQEKTAGQVNAAVSIRSAGSVLKPFIYAEAIDAGLICESTMLDDVPVRYGSYAPVNFDGTFRGAVTASEALSTSLNIPALNLVSVLGVDRVMDKFAEMRLLRGKVRGAAAEKGLTLALGTGGGTLLEITNAYTVLARGGAWCPATFLKDNVEGGKTVFSGGASDMIALMLRSNQLPGTTLDVAWKTGTSNGLRDAWCIAYTPDYSLGVWFGNKNGKASSYLAGAELAAPAAGRIMSNLYGGRDLPRWTVPGDSLRLTVLCGKSGMPPGDECTDMIEGWTVPGYRLKTCTACRAVSKPVPVRILSPKPVVYTVKDNGSVNIPLKSNYSNITWYADDDCLEGGAVSYTFRPGNHKILALSNESTDFAEVRFSVTVK